MNEQVIDKIKETLQDLNNLSPEKLQGLVKETVAVFQTIQSKVSSTNEGDREEGLQLARNLKAAMEEQVQKLQEKLGMTSEQIEEYLANPANFSKAELKSMDESKRDMEQFKTTQIETPKRKPKKKNLLIVT